MAMAIAAPLNVKQRSLISRRIKLVYIKTTACVLVGRARLGRYPEHDIKYNKFGISSFYISRVTLNR